MLEDGWAVPSDEEISDTLATGASKRTTKQATKQATPAKSRAAKGKSRVSVLREPEDEDGDFVPAEALGSGGLFEGFLSSGTHMPLSLVKPPVLRGQPPVVSASMPLSAWDPVSMNPANVIHGARVSVAFPAVGSQIGGQRGSGKFWWNSEGSGESVA